MLALPFLLAWRLPWPSPYAGVWHLTATSVAGSAEVDPPAYPDVRSEVTNDTLTIAFVNNTVAGLPFQLIVVDEISAAVPKFTLFDPSGGLSSGQLNFTSVGGGLRTAVGVLNGSAFTVALASESDIEVSWSTVDEKCLKVVHAVKAPSELDLKRLLPGWFGVVIFTFLGLSLIPDKLAAQAEEKKKTD